MNPLFRMHPDGTASRGSRIFGLLVAVPAVWLFNYFTSKVTSFSVEMENSASELVDYFIKQRSKALRG